MRRGNRKNEEKMRNPVTPSVANTQGNDMIQECLLFSFTTHNLGGMCFFAVVVVNIFY